MSSTIFERPAPGISRDGCATTIRPASAVRDGVARLIAPLEEQRYHFA